jgi:uncharacterized protein (TIGR02270 family)
LPIIESIISQHAEEVAFLWLLRDVAVGAPHYSLKDLADLDARVADHIDGLRIAGDEGWPFCEHGLDHQESGEVFAAAVIALEGDDRRRIDQVVAAVEAVPETARGLVSAIGWITPDKLQGKVAGLLGSASPLWRRVGIAACAVHRVDCGKHLTEAIEDPDPRLRARALRAVGETARRTCCPRFELRSGRRYRNALFGRLARHFCFQSGARYLVGTPVSDIHCRRILRLGMQRQRKAAALELALVNPGTVLFETRAPGFRQRALLG